MKLISNSCLKIISLSSANQTFVRSFSFKIYTANLESINQQDEMITKIKSGKNEVGTRSFVRIQYIRISMKSEHQ